MKLWRRSAGLILILTFLGCASAPKPQMGVSIGDIQNHPRNFSGKLVGITGEVTDTFSLIVYKYFVLKDDTGEIEVVTSKALPRKGETLTVEGTVDEAFSIGSATKTIIREKS